MAYGEYMNLGSEADPNMIFINLSWGLGMGIIADGRLYYGKSGYSGEIGHFPALNNDIICRCGKVGCLETGASGSALHRIMVDELKRGHSSSLLASYQKNGDIELDEILKAVEEGDVLAIDSIGKIGDTLGRGIAGVLNIFNPGLVVIGGRLIVGRGLPAAAHQDGSQPPVAVARVLRHQDSPVQARPPRRLGRRLPAVQGQVLGLL